MRLIGLCGQCCRMQIECLPARPQCHVRSVSSSCALVRPKTTRSSTSVSRQVIGSIPFSFAVSSASLPTPNAVPRCSATIKMRIALPHLNCSRAMGCCLI